MPITGFNDLPALNVVTGDPGSVSETTPVAPGQLGRVGSLYPNSTYWATTFSLGSVPIMGRYILRSSTDATTISTGSMAYWKDYDDFVVTSDASDAYDGVGLNHVAGVFLGASPAAGKYGFIGVGGVLPFLLKGSPTSAADTTGKPIIAESAADNTFDCTTSWGGNPRPVGVALAAKNTPTGIGTDVVKGLGFFVPMAGR